MATILVADDEAKMRKILSLALMEDGHEILEAKDAVEAAEIIGKTSLSLVITDLRMPGGGGMAVLQAVKNVSHYIPVIILTAYGTIENAVETLKNGAHDYLLKPCDLEEIKLTVRKAIQVQHLELENLYLRRELYGRFGEGDLVGRDPNMLRVFDLVQRLSLTDSVVLVKGESGTGKETIARAIHRKSSRREHSFIAIQCGGTPADLLEIDLFGRIRGMKTNASLPATGKFELAEGGTLFFDEIGDIPPRLQGKILRVIEERLIEPVGSAQCKKVDVRIIAATNYDLEEMVHKEQFRSDLFFRLSVVPIVLPPLRDRKEDMPLLVEHFLRVKGRGRAPIAFSGEDIEAMMRYHWPGNLRELENVVERAIVLGDTDIKALLPSLHTSLVPSSQLGVYHKELLNRDYKDAKRFILDEFEIQYFTNLLKRANGNISRAAQMANVHRKNLHVKLGELGIDPRQFAKPEAAGEEPSESIP
ncbi:MAG: sigma-54 dependent transcriptional regulator [Candidatus Omnitrophota bacterium]